MEEESLYKQREGYCSAEPRSDKKKKKQSLLLDPEYDLPGNLTELKVLIQWAWG